MRNRTTMRVSAIALATLLALLTGVQRVDAGGKKNSGKIRLAGFGAHLFYEPLGKVDPRDLMDHKVVLWNTMIGEGEAEAPSNTTLVIVKLSGGPFLTGTRGTVAFRAKSDERVLKTETALLSSFFNDGETLAIPFVVVGTGCGRVELTAELTTPRGRQRQTEALEYPCGE